MLDYNEKMVYRYATAVNRRSCAGIEKPHNSRESTAPAYVDPGNRWIAVAEILKPATLKGRGLFCFLEALCVPTSCATSAN